MASEVIGFKIEPEEDIIRITQDEPLSDEHFIVISIDQVDDFCKLLMKERDKIKRQK